MTANSCKCPASVYLHTFNKAIYELIFVLKIAVLKLCNVILHKLPLIIEFSCTNKICG